MKQFMQKTVKGSRSQELYPLFCHCKRFRKSKHYNSP